MLTKTQVIHDTWQPQYPQTSLALERRDSLRTALVLSRYIADICSFSFAFMIYD